MAHLSHVYGDELIKAIGQGTGKDSQWPQAKLSAICTALYLQIALLAEKCNIGDARIA